MGGVEKHSVYPQSTLPIYPTYLSLSIGDPPGPWHDERQARPLQSLPHLSKLPLPPTYTAIINSPSYIPFSIQHLAPIHLPTTTYLPPPTHHHHLAIMNTNQQQGGSAGGEDYLDKGNRLVHLSFYLLFCTLSTPCTHYPFFTPMCRASFMPAHAPFFALIHSCKHIFGSRTCTRAAIAVFCRLLPLAPPPPSLPPLFFHSHIHPSQHTHTPLNAPPPTPRPRRRREEVRPGQSGPGQGARDE